ncbi:hypothetical protein [Rubritalea sp.]|uniref:hypothetical protein n=1 Tax=Rubritalea sp. TaxID=2109375 RepID=UPI003EF4BAE3
MSLHANLSTEAQLALESQKKKSTFYSIIISILICALLVIILSILVMATVSKKTPELVSYSMGVAETESIEKPEIVNEVARTPSAPSQMTSVIASSAAASMSIPTVDFSLDTASIEFGAGEDFGDGIDGDLFGDSSAATGAASGFGSSSKVLGTIEGHFYDFKQDRRGRPAEGYRVGNKSFTAQINKFHQARFKESGLRDHFKADKTLYSRFIAIPNSKADAAPRFFGVENEVKPSGWLVHYSGELKAAKTGRYRLVGHGDDYVGAAINGKPALVGAWTSIASAVKIDGANAESQPNHRGPFKQNLIYGRWFDLKEGETFKVDVAIGENPGGWVGFVLLVEEEGEKYKKDKQGNPILPPFTFGDLVAEDKESFEKFEGWEFDLKNIPSFQSID